MAHRRLVLALPLAALATFGCARDEAPPAAKSGGAAAAEKSAAGGGAPDWAAAFKHAERWDGAKKAVVVDLEIAPGFHAYTTGETVGKPLVVELAAETPWVVEGAVVYPAGVTKDLPLGRSVIVEGKSEIVAPVKAKDGAPAGPVQGSLRYQVCTEKACDRPRTAAFTVAVAP